MKDLIIIGSGGVGEEVALIIEQINKLEPEWNIIGFVDDDISKKYETVLGYPIVGTIDDLINSTGLPPYTVCAIGNPRIKEEIVARVEKNGNIKWATIVDPSIILNRTIDIGEGSIIYQSSTLTSNVGIGKHVIVSPKCGLGHGSKVHDYSTVLWGVNISGDTVIEKGSYIGSGATIIQQLNVGEGSTVGAGAVVIRNVPKGRTVVGVPAKSKND